jgi:hypothetical protein
VWLKNRTSTRALEGMTPYEAVHGKVPNMSDVHEWGCKCYVHQQMDVVGQSKLDWRAKDGHWMGMDETSQGHRIYWPGERKVTVERTVIFAPFVVLKGNEGEYGAPPASEKLSNPHPSTPSIKNSPAVAKRIPLPPSEPSETPSSSATPPPDSPPTPETH